MTITTYSGNQAELDPNTCTFLFRHREIFCLQVLAQLGSACSLILLSHCESFPLALMFMTLAIGMTGFHNAGGMVLPQDMAPEYAGSVAGFSNTISTFSGT